MLAILIVVMRIWTSLSGEWNSLTTSFISCSVLGARCANGDSIVTPDRSEQGFGLPGRDRPIGKDQNAALLLFDPFGEEGSRAPQLDRVIAEVPSHVDAVIRQALGALRHGPTSHKSIWQPVRHP